jgi:tRNA A-37 threonylcarbamoyl transferase component Bud32
VVNTEWYPDSIFGAIQETLIYSRIEGHGIGPKFLAHITENSERVYGYMLESLPARHATMDDLQACKAVLAKLHGLKIVHGALSSLSFLMVDGRALLHRFGGSFSTDDQSVFDMEMASVGDVLQRGSPPTLHISEELRAEIFAISQRDDGIHPEVLRQAAEQGKISITEEQHKRLLQELRERLRKARSHAIAL